MNITLVHTANLLAIQICVERYTKPQKIYPLKYEILSQGTVGHFDKISTPFVRQ